MGFIGNINDRFTKLVFLCIILKKKEKKNSKYANQIKRAFVDCLIIS